jgi:hypothetical protein
MACADSKSRRKLLPAYASLSHRTPTYNSWGKWDKLFPRELSLHDRVLYVRKSVVWQHKVTSCTCHDAVSLLGIMDKLLG